MDSRALPALACGPTCFPGGGRHFLRRSNLASDRQNLLERPNPPPHMFVFDRLLELGQLTFHSKRNDNRQVDVVGHPRLPPTLDGEPSYERKTEFMLLQERLQLQGTFPNRLRKHLWRL